MDEPLELSGFWIDYFVYWEGSFQILLNSFAERIDIRFGITDRTCGIGGNQVGEGDRARGWYY